MWDVHAHGGVLLMVGLGERAILRCKLGAEKKQDVFLKRKNRAMTPILNGTGPLYKKCDLNTLLFHLNPFRPTFLFKKASTKTFERPATPCSQPINARSPASQLDLRLPIPQAIHPFYCTATDSRTAEQPPLPTVTHHYGA